MNSERFTIIKQDLLKIGKGALFAFGGTLIGYFLSTITDADFGKYAAAYPLFSIGLHALYKYLTATEYLP